MKFGYMRVSTIEQNLDRQEQQLKEAGCERIFFEKVTGTKRNRPELNHMLEFLRQGDTVVVTDLTRLSRSTKDLIEIAELISHKGANLKSLKEAWLDTTTAHGKMLFTVFAGIAQFERDLTSERTKEGIMAAKKRGKYPGRPKTDEEKVNYALYLIEQGTNRTDAAEKAGISRMTLYRKIQQKDN
ncbi:recombinase family protein [Bacillus pseudomycoides]|uniref:Recombinase n=1 Tax=Bacillus pseudomycoides TaxID=64104 RepID=A0ABD6TJ39_9BACI|nr:recombinase family protein [Bacillus pseudomycoides]MDR4191009.1 recombinase family protein [Bacillus pseudomycoides]MED0856697.1 recombinase family protein [Bacillus pseudomycoides]PGR97631.1 recombinase [Bacillus pseudomycoides]PHF04077.1 recombinase [Bacillus pseudomycoides]